MTTWEARRKPLGGGDYKVMCGRIDRISGRSACPEIVAFITYVDGALATAAPARLTEQGTPGEWRETAHATKRIGERRRVATKRGSMTIGGERAALAHLAALPCTMPCPRGHMNHLDASLLDE